MPAQQNIAAACGTTLLDNLLGNIRGRSTNGFSSAIGRQNREEFKTPGVAPDIPTE